MIPLIMREMQQNFKKFPELGLRFNAGSNVLIGDSEYG